MKNSFLLAILFAVISILSCKKKSDALVPYNGSAFFPPIPNMAGVDNTLPYPVIPNVWGVFVSITIRGNYSDSLTKTPLYANDAVADFATEAGAVSINNHLLDTSEISFSLGWVYYNQSTDPSDTFNFINNDKWIITGSNNLPGLLFDYSGSFPSFTGILPTVLSSNGLSLAFDASNNSGADSAFIMVKGLTSAGESFSTNSKVVSAIDGIAVLTASDLNYYNFDLPTVYLEIFLYKYTIKTFGNKQFAFVKLEEVVKNVTVN